MAIPSIRPLGIIVRILELKRPECPRHVVARGATTFLTVARDLNEYPEDCRDAEQTGESLQTYKRSI